MAGNSILVVEDDQDIRENMIEILSGEGYVVLVAEHGKAGIEVLLANQGALPRCIVLDLSMPVMDGLTFIKTLHEKHAREFAHIPIIVTTAKGSPTDPASIPIAVEYLRKPVDLDMLLSTIERHCAEAK